MLNTSSLRMKSKLLCKISIFDVLTDLTLQAFKAALNPM